LIGFRGTRVSSTMKKKPIVSSTMKRNREYCFRSPVLVERSSVAFLPSRRRRTPIRWSYGNSNALAAVLILLTVGKSSLSARSFSIDNHWPVAKNRCSGHRNACNGNNNSEHRETAKSLKKVPPHVAFICDGNSRWAAARNLPASVGHAAGADRLVHVLDDLKAAGVSYCTVYGFSTENWKRPPSETRAILNVMEQAARKFYDRAVKECVRVRVLGDLSDERVPRSLVEILQMLERDTSKAVSDDGGQGFTICLAVNYGGRRDILNAAKSLATRIVEGSLAVEDVTEDVLASLLTTKDLPDPDLVIRTSGERRLSNFLLWNLAYTELYFTDVFWPDFDATCVADAILWYAQRQRRFGARETIDKEAVTSNAAQ
jgi:undecaprenyl diphosphate synthase